MWLSVLGAEEWWQQEGKQGLRFGTVRLGYMVGTYLRVRTFPPFSLWGIVEDFNQGNGMMGFTLGRRSLAVMSSADSKSGRLEAEGQVGG